MAAKGYRQLGVEAAARLGVWLMGNLEWAQTHTAHEISERVRTDLKIEHITAGMVHDLCKKLNIPIKSARGTSTRAQATDRTHIVAVAVRDLYEQMNLPVPPLLLAVVNRKQAKERENG